MKRCIFNLSFTLLYACQSYTAGYAQATVSTLTGSLTGGYQDGVLAGALFASPKGLTRDCNNNLYVAEWNNTGKIRKVNLTTGQVSTIAQSGFSNPNDIAYDVNSNTLVFPEFGGGSRIMRTDMSGTVTSIAGTTSGYLDGVVSIARFSSPAGVAIAPNGDVYVADYGNNTIRKIAGGIVSTIAGNGTSGCSNGSGAAARFSLPTGLAFDRNGNVIVADYGNHVIRKIDPSGNVTTIAGICGSAGSANGTLASATFNNPHGVYVDYQGNIFVAEFSNHRIRKIDPVANLVTTIAGTGAAGYADGPGASAQFNYPFRVTGNLAGTLYVPDATNNMIREVKDQGTTPVINGLQKNYCLNAATVTLSPAPPGGTLSGAGISGNTFSPALAGTGVHIISYTITDLFNCSLVRKDTISVSDTPSVNLGADIDICADSVILQSSNSYTNPIYRWSNGATTASVALRISGIYWLEVNQGGCMNSDTIMVNLNPGLSVNLGNDTGICDNAIPYTLKSSQPAGTIYRWSNGSSDTSIQVSTTGTYWLEADLNGCKGQDTIRLKVVPTPFLFIGPDSIICADMPLRMGSMIAGAMYLWNTGSTQPYVSVSASGRYWLQVNLDGCIVSDTADISAMPAPIIDLGEDKDICPGQSVMLRAGSSPDNTYLWSTGSLTPDITVNQSGTYHVSITSAAGCVSRDTIVLTSFPLPVVALGKDTTVCEENPLTIMAIYSNSDSMLWSDGSEGKNMTISKGGLYYVSVFNKCGVGSDTIRVRQVFCDIWLPNAFTPNGDGINDVLLLLGNTGRLKHFRMMIYNRWGEQVFFTEDKYTGWNGTYHGDNCATGTYAYLLEYGLEDRAVLHKGNITLLR